MNIVILIKKGGGTGPTKPWQPFIRLISFNFGANSFSNNHGNR